MTRTEALRAVVLAWPIPDGAVATAADLLAIASADPLWRGALFQWCPPRGRELLPTARALGCMLSRVRGIALDGFTIAVVLRGASGALWVRRRVEALSALEASTPSR